ncbi:MAG: ChuX/HutX family heme-like substrate-binding protein [Bacteroidota bacterium]
MKQTATSLLYRWVELKTQKPKLRIRNAAEELGVSEVELLATKCGESVIRLKPLFSELLGEIEGLGKVMALSRNDNVVHERKGIYQNASLAHPHVGLFVGEDIDLRIFFKAWDSAFAVKEIVGKEGREKSRWSLQFFASNGEAIHKIYLTPHSDVVAFLALVEAYRHDDQGQMQSVRPKVAESAELSDAEIDVDDFQASWRNLNDTHDFFGLLQKHKLSRTQALRLAPKGDYAVAVGNTALREIISKAANRGVPIMVFVGNQGIIQIHTGPVKKLMDFEDWFNILDPDFNLHVKEPAIAQSWVVRKPTKDGVVTALECFDKERKQIAQFFGKRKPGLPELNEWREIVAEVEQSLKKINV